MADIIWQGGTGRIVADQINLNSKNGNLLRLSGDSGFSLEGTRAPVLDSVFSRTIGVSESNTIFVNTSAGGTVVLTLPDTTEFGIVYKFVRVASQAIRIDPPAGSSIIYSGGTMTTGEYLELASDGAKLHLVSDGSGNWIATYEYGTLTEETP